MTRHPEPTHALASYVDALVQIGGQLTTVLHHMWEHRSPEAELDPAQALAALIADVMPPRLASRDVDLKIAARLINATARAIEDDLFLVADDESLDPPGVNGSDRLH